MVFTRNKIIKWNGMKTIIRTKDMSKKEYNRPEMNVILLQHEAHLLSESLVPNERPTTTKEWEGEID
jgi:hypothetical protein